jgi:hypothetical protein
VKKRLVTIALGALSIPVLGGAAYAVSQSVDDRPTPKVVIPSASTQPATPAVDDHGGNRPPGVSDDGPQHDVGDDHGGNRPPGVSDDGPQHNVGDDHGGRRGSNG